MPTHGSEVYEEKGLSDYVREVSDRLSQWWRLEIELALIEVKHGLRKIALGVGLLLAAALFGLFSLGFFLATIAAAIGGSGMWLGLIIVAGGLLVVSMLLGAGGASALKKARPVPEEALKEAKTTRRVLQESHREHSHVS